MIALLCFFLTLPASPFKSKNRLAAENAALRHQLIVLQRRVSGRVQLTNGDRLHRLPRDGVVVRQGVDVKEADQPTRGVRHALMRRCWKAAADRVLPAPDRHPNLKRATCSVLPPSLS